MISSKLRTLENNLIEIERDLKTREDVIYGTLVGFFQFVQEVADAREQKLSTNVVNLNTKLQKIEANLVELATNISQYKRLSTAMAASEEPYASCLEEPLKKSGKYSIQIGPYKKAITVYCEQTDYGGGWTVLQHRFDGSENFFRNWSDYRDGFGNLDVNSQQSFQTHAIVNSQQSPGISSFSTHATSVNTVSNLPRHKPSPVPRANANVRESVVINQQAKSLMG
ncbi:AGAP012916-PA-like protein [Anopheles sinensis]|uniref:AGAP012916-PA-like protein n=1 Tax=Anopheles sinensis TaxID=74873 RepID=A0A084W3U4_ANOSI|nr:AGAP012916-PA-like protein [Anopheles sinensis]